MMIAGNVSKVKVLSCTCRRVELRRLFAAYGGAKRVGGCLNLAKEGTSPTSRGETSHKPQATHLFLFLL